MRWPPGLHRSETDALPVCIPPRQSTESPVDDTVRQLPHASGTIKGVAIGTSSDAAVVAATCQCPSPSISPAPAASTPSAPDVPPASGPPDPVPSFRGIAAGAMAIWAAARCCCCIAPGLELRPRLATSPVVSSGTGRSPPRFAGRRLRPGWEFVVFLCCWRRAARSRPGGWLGAIGAVLPERLLGAVSNDELEDVLVHELAHVRRGDQWTVLLEGLVAVLYWPIVSVHLLNRELRRAREEVCDNVVLAGRNGVSYGETLLHIAQSLVNIRSPYAAVGVLGGRGELERRIAGLIDPARNMLTAIGRKAACVVVLLFVAWARSRRSTRFAALAGAAELPKPEPKPVASSPASADGAPAKPPGAAELTETGSNRTIILRGKVLGPGDRPLAGARFLFESQ